MSDKITREEFERIFLQLKKGLDSVALELSQDDSDVLHELFVKLKAL